MRRSFRIAFALGVLSAGVCARPLQSTNPRFQGAPAATDPKALYQALNALQVNGSRVFTVRELHLKRSAFDITLNEGKLAFLKPLDNRVTGAVFTGRGSIVALPRDPAERRSLAEFLGVPILDQPFSRAYLRFTDDTAVVLEDHLEAAKTDVAGDPAFADIWNTAIAKLNPAHSVRVMFDLLSSDPQPYFAVTVGGSRVGPFDALVDRRMAEPVMIGQPAAGSGTARYDIWASFTPADVPAATETLSPVSYRVDTTIADDLSLTGDAHLDFKARRDGERMIRLELSRALSAESVSIEGGAALTFFQNDDLSQQEIASRGNDALYVVLPAATRSQEEIQLEVRYRGSVISDTGNGVYFVGDRGSWYPHESHGGQFARFDLTFRWPRKLTLVATGHEVDEHEEGGRRIGHWTTTVPISVAGFNLGEYEKESAGTGKPAIELYANHQLDDWIVTRLRSHMISESARLAESSEGATTKDPFGDVMEVGPGAPPSPSGVLKHLGAVFTDGIRFLEGINGPFPFDELDVAPIPGDFGQGWPGLVYLSTLAYVPRESQQDVGIDRRQQEEIAELLPFHETAHQWWGNQSAAASYRDGWLYEAVANYEALMYADSKKPSAHILTNWLNHFRSQLLTTAPGAEETDEETGPLTLGYRLNSSKTPRAYEEIIYGKGTWVIHMLRVMLREPNAKSPDAKFVQMLRSALDDHRFQPITTNDLKHAAEKHMTPAMDLEGNHRLDWFFEEWVRDTGIPHYSVEFQARPRGQEFLITGKLKQDDVPEYFTEAVPLYATRTGSKPTLLGTVTTTSQQTSFHFTSAFKPGKIVIDPQNTILCKPE
ncbi:MAG: M1 family aminopeptidase [Candidatus Acidiferrales bacterium]